MTDLALQRTLSGHADLQVQYTKVIANQLAKNRAHLESLHYAGSKLGFPVDPEVYPEQDPNLRVFFFDIDNTLYSKSTHIQDLMVQAIMNYLENYLGLDHRTATLMNKEYYKRYGLLVKGLVANNGIDALDYNSMVDDSLPLQNVLSEPNLQLRKMLQDLRASGKFDKLWLFTNAYKNHALRIVKILGIADLFDGITYCDYTQSKNLICKPDARAFEKAKLESGLGDYRNGYFIDDSGNNIRVGLELGLKCVHLQEDTLNNDILGDTPDGALVVKNILDLPKEVPHLFQDQ
ncbi:hypothetical protein TPHA_0A05900 [Tetrapisispora phaffii CBS 4417]|uniref:Pyrimidine 5'-nucleotidase n=1 Tax=Tetrapisispora phaffii (strain ATCC 24235 / CBS 4417 / NBRC 1672 / NRRL Y-8282 / UCD 70-5) TaxID=1071381 RepID=G8BP36_TETPH|nr:hypothetical protein TPHA_0A05900 [Tetrapisispora phaffii CBS 4417]CCE61664.1 hypothetical protein TPHA_0A05900 [Tetrapisispora phaffii CBS 4417]